MMEANRFRHRRENNPAIRRHPQRRLGLEESIPRPREPVRESDRQSVESLRGSGLDLPTRLAQILGLRHAPTSRPDVSSEPQPNSAHAGCAHEPDLKQFSLPLEVSFQTPNTTI